MLRNKLKRRRTKQIGGVATVANSEISGDTSPRNGGGICAYGTAVTNFTNCSIVGNTGCYGGGYISYDATISSFTNCLVAKNASINGGQGGGLKFTGDGWNSTLTNCSVVDNVCAFQGGIYVHNGPLTLRNTVVAFNGAREGGDVFNWKATTLAYNVISGFTAWNGGANRYAYAASLPLFNDAANGDYTLAPNSQAVDKGNDAYVAELSTDLAGNARVVGKSVDIGAYELRPETPSLVVTTNLDVINNADDKISLREAILYAHADATLGDTITFAPSLKGATIKLFGTQLEIKQAITIDASALYNVSTQTPGLTVDADGKSRVFRLNGGTNAATLNNVIIAENSSPNADDSDVYLVADAGSVDACNVLSSFTDWSNANADGVVHYVYDATLPLCKDTANGDYSLAPGSQAIDKGNDAYAVDASGAALQTDLAWNPRFVGTVDLGAYEYGDANEPSLVVTTSNDKVDAYDGWVSLREAILYASADATLGDTMTFAPSLKGATITLAGSQLVASKPDLTVDATALYDAENDAPGLTLDGGGKSRIFLLVGGTADAPITLKGLTLTGGFTAEKGGAVYAPNSATNVELCVFANNVAKDCGGAFDSSNSSKRGYSFVSTKFIDNYAGRDGGAVGLLGTRGAFVDCVFEGNKAAGVGGALSVHKMELTVSGTRFSNNVAADGGALYLRSNGELIDCVFAGNTASASGGVYIQSDLDASDTTPTATLTNCVVSNNSATNDGGGIYVGANATLTATDCKVFGNSASYGGGYRVSGSGTVLTVDDGRIYGNEATTNGGGLHNNGGTAERRTLRTSRFTKIPRLGAAGFTSTAPERRPSRIRKFTPTPRIAAAESPTDIRRRRLSFPIARFMRTKRPMEAASRFATERRRFFRIARLPATSRRLTAAV